MGYVFMCVCEYILHMLRSNILTRVHRVHVICVADMLDGLAGWLTGCRWPTGQINDSHASCAMRDVTTTDSPGF